MALSVVARVVSENERYWIVDCGSKVLSSDTGAHGTASALFPGFGRAVPLLTAAHSLPDGASFARHSVGVARLSEEHGWLAKSGADAASGAPTLRVGDLVRVYPNHSCVVANLASEFWLTDIKDPRRVSRMPVDARGCTI
jgi:D-serine deaminase-like pyridoxal phosphate-dependent protein